MPRGSLLGCLEKREILNQPAVSVESLSRWGQVFSELDLFHDAMDFYEKAGDEEPIRNLMTLAREEGNLFLFKRACKALKLDPDVDQWLNLGRNAKERGLLLYAAEAFRMAGVDHEVSGEPLNE
jgi:hypothetical protein